MIIQTVDIFPYSIPFTSPLHTASRSIRSRTGFILRLTGNGQCGYGESAPIPGLSIDSIVDCKKSLDQVKQNVESIRVEPSVEDWLAMISTICRNSPSAQFGLETAIYDLASQWTTQPLAAFLSPDYSPSVQVNALFRKGYILPDGVRVTKIKVLKGDISPALQLLDKLSRKANHDHRFRLDINGGWDLQEAIRNFTRLEGYPIDYIEQPLPADNLMEIVELKRHASIPIALDESLTSLASARQIIERNAADVLIIKPMVTGGFSEVHHIVSLAERHHLRCVLTTSLETAVGRLATLHLAAANKITEPCGLDTGFLLSSDVAAFPDIKNGRIALPPYPGLGIRTVAIPKRKK